MAIACTKFPSNISSAASSRNESILMSNARTELESAIEDLALALIDSGDIKAVMMSKDDYGNVRITLVEGRETSNKVHFGTVEHASRRLRRTHDMQI